MRNALSTLALAGALVLGSPSARAEIDWPRVDAAMGREATVVGTVHRYDLPRLDLRAALDGVELAPGLALAGWVAFLQIGRYAMMRGDIVIPEAEAPLALKRLLAHGVHVSGAHSHLLRARPAVTHLHLAAYGDPAELAQTVRAASRSEPPPSGQPAATPELALAELGQIELALGAKGRKSLGVVQFMFPRTEEVRASGAPAPAAAGAGTVLNFQPLGEGRAAVAGEFAALAPELTPLIETLQAGGIEIAGLCDHMPDDQPRLFFVHVFAKNDAVQLAYALKRGLDVLAGDAASIQPAPAPARARTGP